MKNWLSILFALACAGNLLASDVASDFTAANEFYARGKFSEAATAYEKILQSGSVSANLLFNYGNAEFKAGNPGKAIAAYRRAELLSPRDENIRANLNFVRTRVQGETVRESAWRKWLGQLTLNEWTMAAAAAFWVTFLLLALRQMRRDLSPKLRWATMVAAVLTLLAAGVTALEASEHFSNRVAVVISPEATARTGPFDDAQDSFAVHDGAELTVLDRHGGWTQVVDASGRTGWLETKQVEILPGA